MERFGELLTRCASYTTHALDEVASRDWGDLNASTPYVKSLQAAELGRVVVAVGIFSIFEAKLQKDLRCKDGFSDLRRLLVLSKQESLGVRFELYAAAINVLKHGRGRSYEYLLANWETLPFMVKARDQGYFYEGDVSEPDTLVQVDNAFIQNCAQLVEELINTAVLDAYYEALGKPPD